MNFMVQKGPEWI